MDLGTREGLIVSFGEMLIDFVPSMSGVSLAEASMFEKAPGGAPANVAVAIAKFGGFSAFIGKVVYYNASFWIRKSEHQPSSVKPSANI